VFKEAVEHIIKNNEKVIITSGIAENVKAGFCDVKREGLPKLTKVRYNSSIETPEDFIKVTPAEGSYVLCGIIENDLSEAVVLNFGSIQEIKAKIGNITIFLNAEGCQINGNNYEGLVKAPELKTQIDKNTAIIKAIQEAFTNWITAPNDGGAALKKFNRNIYGNAKG